jgi:exonuclease SbcC
MASLGTVYNDAEKVLWEEFKDLSQNAYAPCQRYFDEQNAIQEQNATARQQLCDELQQYLDNLPK